MRWNAYHLRHNKCQTTDYHVEQRLHTYRTNWTLLLFASDYASETGDYTDAMVYCQARVAFLLCSCVHKGHKKNSKEPREEIPDAVACNAQNPDDGQPKHRHQ